MDVACELDKGLVPPGGGKLLLWVQCTHGGVKAASPPSVSIAAALDRSASMRGDKLEAMKAAARSLVDQLSNRDRLVLVAFDSGAEVLAAGNVVNRAEFKKAIDGIQCKSGTNIGLGIETTGRYLLGDDSGNVRRILLLTDGEVSTGERTPGGLSEIVRSFSSKEIGLTSLGFGLEYDEDLLSKLAHQGGGRLHHVTDGGKLAAIYAGELGRMRSLAARWIQIKVTGLAGTRAAGIRHDFPCVAQGDAIEVACSDLRSGETKGVLVDLEVPAKAAGEDGPLCAVTVRWQDADGHVSEKTQELTVKHVDAATAEKAPQNGAVLVQVALLDAARAKERALADADVGRFASGSVRLMNSLAVIGTARAMAPGSARLDEEMAELEKLAGELADGNLDASRRKELRVQIHDGTTPIFRERLDAGDGPPI